MAEREKRGGEGGEGEIVDDKRCKWKKVQRSLMFRHGRERKKKLKRIWPCRRSRPRLGYVETKGGEGGTHKKRGRGIKAVVRHQSKGERRQMHHETGKKTIILFYCLFIFVRYLR